MSLEKNRQVKKSITTLYDKEGKIITDPTEILNRQKEFYENLYTSNNPDTGKIKQFIKNTKIDYKLNEVDNSKCEGKLSEEECYNTIFNMKLNKSPGSDGLTTEFYREFYETLKYLLINSLNEGYEKGKFSTTQRTGLLSLMYKKNDPLDLANW